MSTWSSPRKPVEQYQLAWLTAVSPLCLVCSGRQDCLLWKHVPWLRLCLVFPPHPACTQVFTLTEADAEASLQAVRSGIPTGEQLAPPSAAPARHRKARRLHGEDTAWTQAREVADGDAELQEKLDRELQVHLRTGQHAASALAGVKVERMKHIMPHEEPADHGADHQK